MFRVSGYGGSSVFENTVAATQNAGLTVGMALSCDDVDTPEDLKELMKTIDPGSHTGRFLAQLTKEGMTL